MLCQTLDIAIGHQYNHLEQSLSVQGQNILEEKDDAR